jgi:hypothetical protein
MQGRGFTERHLCAASRARTAVMYTRYECEEQGATHQLRFEGQVMLDIMRQLQPLQLLLLLAPASYLYSCGAIDWRCLHVGHLNPREKPEKLLRQKTCVAISHQDLLHVFNTTHSMA